jgi:hypothetical protein
MEAAQMIVIGLVLILAAGATAVFAGVASANSSVVVDMHGMGVAISATPLAMYVAGALSVVLIGLGFALISGGARRKVGARKELRRLRKGQAVADAGTSNGTGEGSHRPDRAKPDSEDGSTNSNTESSR